MTRLNPLVSKQSLLEWLNEIPNDVEIGIEIGQLGNVSLVAGDPDSDQWLFAFGAPNISHDNNDR